MEICFTIGGRTYCIPIPILIWPWPWPKPNGNGDPYKAWLTAERINMVIVATVAALAKHAQGDLRGRLEQVVHAEIPELKKQLPEGATIEMKG